MCPSGDNCVCYSATKTSLHTATGSAITIPPGTTKVAVSVDNTLNTSHPGCKPAWGEIDYTQTRGGTDTATIEFFASLCSPLFCNLAPELFRRGSLDERYLGFEAFSLSGITGLGTATGTYSPANTGTNLTLNLTAVLVPGGSRPAGRPTYIDRRASNITARVSRGGRTKKLRPPSFFNATRLYEVVGAGRARSVPHRSTMISPKDLEAK